MSGGRRVYEVWVGRQGASPYRIGVWRDKAKAEEIRAYQEEVLNEFISDPARKWIAWVENKKVGGHHERFNTKAANAIAERRTLAIPGAVSQGGAGPAKGS